MDTTLSSGQIPDARSGQDPSFLAGGGDVGSLMRALDWSATPIGAPASWPVPLRTLVDVTLGSNQPMFIAWGPDHTLIYNDAYAEILGLKHPAALGSPFLSTWSEIREDLLPIVARAFAGESVHMDDITLVMQRHGYPEETHFSFSYTPIRDATGAIAGFFCPCTETTRQVLAERRMRESDAQAKEILEGMGEGFLVLGRDFHIRRINGEGLRIDGRPREALVGRHILEVWPELDTMPTWPLYQRAMADRRPAELVYRHRSDDHDVWLEVRAYPSGEDLAIFYRDVTEAKRAEVAWRESEDNYRHAVELSPQTVWTSTPSGELDHVGMRWQEWTGTNGLGSSWGDVIHPDDLPPSVEAWTRSVTTGILYDIEHRVRVRDGAYRWMHSRAYPRRDEHGAIVKWYGTTEDIEEQKLAEAALSASEAHLRAITDSIDQMIWSTRPDGHHDYYNARWYEFTGTPMGSTDGEAWNGMFHPADRERAWESWRQSLATGDLYQIEYRLRHWSGQYRWVLGRAQPLRDASGRITRWYGTCTDIHDQKLAEDALRESRDRLAIESHALEVLNRTGTQVAAELGLDKLVQRVVDAGVELTGARHGTFVFRHQAAPDRRDGMPAGADPAGFGITGLPRPDGIFAPTSPGEGAVRSNDVLTDPRFGPDMTRVEVPDGQLPVRSYLAVPVSSRFGEVIGALLFGHPQPNMFTERSERVVTGLAAQAAIGIDNARLFEAVQHANADLEQRVRERTAELERVHEVLRQAQKMEAVGQLTGGIAHDFNNMLAIVIGSLDLFARRAGDLEPRAQRLIDSALDGARRAAALTQRLLAFSRQQPLAPEPLDANALVAGMSDLLRRTLSEAIRLETPLTDRLWRTHADPNQLENAILNLAVNARDAMPGGGRLSIVTRNVRGEDGRDPAELGPGDYVAIAITDTGTGMAPEVIAKAFEPFFTTKDIGRGTGLGLSQVYGFVTQSGGHVRIASRIGEGTTVEIYLPRHTGPPMPEHPRPDPPLPSPRSGGREVVLVVEDEAGVRRFSVEALRELGYDVVEADGAAAALRLLDQHPRIAVLFTDMAMPDTNGRELADEALRRRPDLKVLFTTGYTRDLVVQNGGVEDGTHLIGKPFTYDDLAAKMRIVLDRSS